MNINRAIFDHPIIKKFSIKLFSIKYQILLILILHLVFFSFDLISIEEESSRSLLSTLVQCEAAVIAIVISLNIVAVQLVALYSTRSINLFSNHSGTKHLLMLYIFSIVYTLIILKEFGRPANNVHSFAFIDQFIKSNFHQFNINNLVLVALYLGIFSLSILPAYMKEIFMLLEPSTMIKDLSEKISKQSILCASHHSDERSENDPILPIIDIIRQFWLTKYDYEEAMGGLKILRDSINKIIQLEVKETFSLTDQRLLMDHVCHHYYNIGTLAMKRQDESIISHVIFDLESLGISSANKGFDNATKTVLHYIRRLYDLALKKKCFHFIEWIGLSAGNISVSAAESGLDNNARTAMSLVIDVINEFSDRKDCDSVDISLRSLISGLNEILIKSIDKRNYYLSKDLISIMGNIGKKLAEAKCNRPLEDILYYLNEASSPSAQESLDSADIYGDVKLIFQEISNIASRSMQIYMNKKYNVPIITYAT